MTNRDSADENPWADFVTPEREQADAGAEVGDAHDLVIEEINPLNPHLFRADRWHEHFRRLRAEDPVHFNEIESAGRYWSLTKYDDIKAVEGDWQRFSSSSGITLGPPAGIDGPPSATQQGSFIAMDPPQHGDHRMTVQPMMSASSLRNLESTIRTRAATLLDSLPENETFDWVETVSVELTTLMLATLFDFPYADRHKLPRWSDVVFAIPEPGGIVETVDQKRAEMMEFIAYFEQLWLERVEQPGDDMISMLAHGENTGHLGVGAHIGSIMLLIVGGNDTTRNTMSGSVYGLNKFPDQFDKLRNDPSLVSNMVPEIIRWQTPLSYMRRTANVDCEIRGKQIRKDDQVLMWYVSANRDEDVFPDGDRIDIERPNANKHLAFGHGIHYCMGSRMADLQLRILWEEILQRFDAIEVQDEPTRTFSSFVHGYTHLPVKVRRTSTH